MVDAKQVTRRGGRPRKIADEKRSRPVAVKFASSEYEQLKAESTRLGVASVSELIRQRALTGRVQIIARQELSAPDRLALNRVGVNLHQLVKHLNIAGGSLAAIADIETYTRKTLHSINELLVRGVSDDT